MREDAKTRRMRCLCSSVGSEDGALVGAEVGGKRFGLTHNTVMAVLTVRKVCVDARMVP